ncbi:50S ribosomal protein L5 [Patescibacteria group bacterium]|nr:50S ribosomal protein L5 [Patescibacteria group bacterium]MBU1931290.1 50S ribosomal protein L5 [Patescibacteria group bacterium]
MTKPRLQKYYQEKIVSQLKKELALSNSLAVPKIVKVVINVGLKEAAKDKGILEKGIACLSQIAGQKPKVTRARLSIAGFQLREGSPVGLSVTLRNRRMYEFLDKLFTIVLPRVRDFQGVKRSAFDRQGNYTLGLTEQIIFSEVDYDKIDKVRGLEISFITNTNDDKKAFRLLELLGMPFAKESLDG